MTKTSVITIIFLSAIAMLCMPTAAKAHKIPYGTCWHKAMKQAEGKRYPYLIRCRRYVKNHQASHRFDRLIPTKASWYGPGFYGQRTACGRTHTTRSWHVAALTPDLAHCGAKLKICSSAMRCVRVTVQDRGAWRRDGRHIDLAPRVKSALRCGSVCSVRYTRVYSG